MTRSKDTASQRLLDAWSPPQGSGDPIGCIATSFTFNAVLFEEECLSRFLALETHPEDDGAIYLIEREEKLASVVCAAALVDARHCRGARSLRWICYQPESRPSGHYTQRSPYCVGRTVFA